MGFRNALAESLYKLRIIPRQTPSDVTSFTNKEDSLTNRINEAIDSGKRVDFSDLTNINTIRGDRNKKYEIFEDMVSDGRIGAAVEMYANDTVQFNQEGKVIWVESDKEEGKSDIVGYVDKLLQDLHIADNLWSFAYCMWLYGDVYLELFENTSNDNSKPTLLLEPAKHNNNIKIQKPLVGSVLERYIEKVPNPAEIYDLQYKGKTSGYARSESNLQDNNLTTSNMYYYSNTTNDIDLFSPTKYVHICLSPNINRFPEKFRLIKKNQLDRIENSNLLDGSDVEGSGGSLTFSVKTGQSILENVFASYQTLKLKEDSILLERITKSSITRIIQVELGDMPESQKKVKLQEIKAQIEQQILMNKENGTMSNRPGAQPIENIIYTTTKNGKGAISAVNIGGDVQIGNIDDIDSSENKVYGALLVPKALLGADMEGSGLSNGGSLTEMNTTYARRIKRGQSALITALTDLVNIFALAEGVGDKIIGNFKIRLTPIITVEDTRRDELLGTKISNVRDILNLFGDIDSIEDETKIEMLSKWLSNYLSQQDIVEILDNSIKEMEQEQFDKAKEELFGDEQQTTLKTGNMTHTNNTEETHSDIQKPNNTQDIPQEEQNTETERPNLEASEQVDLNDIEGEDLL